MFRLERPNMAVNDPRVKNASGSIRRFHMWNTWDIPETVSLQHIIDWVATVARRARGGKLKNLVLSCHGLPGCLQLGEGVDSSDIALFTSWTNHIEKIWLPDCLVAQTPDAAMRAQMAHDYPTFNVSDGNDFCSKLAKKVKCYVVASTEIQCEDFCDVPMDMMTSFEGLVLCYGPDGNLSWAGANASTEMQADGTCSRVPD